MGLLIDHTCFTGLLDVGLSPDTGADTLTREAERDVIDSYIDLYEKEYLLRVLGESGYELFSGYLEREDDSEEERWEALKSLLCEKPSPVACYVYFRYLGDVDYSVTRSGVVVSTADDDLASPALLQVRAWNLMARLNRRVLHLLSGEAYGDICFDKYMVETVNDLGI